MIASLISIVLYIIIFSIFTIYSLKNWGIPESYSGLYYKWSDYASKPALWEAVTFVCAILLSISLSYFSEWAPCAAFALVGVVVAARFLDNVGMHIIHSVFAGICAIITTVFLVRIGMIWVPIIFLAVLFLLAAVTRTFKSGSCWWLEMALFLGVPVAILVKLIQEL